MFSSTAAVSSVASTCPAANTTIVRSVPSHRSTGAITSTKRIPQRATWGELSQNALVTSTPTGSRCRFARLVEWLDSSTWPAIGLELRSTHEVMNSTNR